MTKNASIATIPDAIAPLPSVATTTIQTDAGTLRALLASVVPACSDDAARMYMTRVLVEVRRDSVTTVATDGRWLAKATAKIGASLAFDGPEVTFLPDPDTVARILKDYCPARVKAANWGVTLKIQGEHLSVSGFGSSATLTDRVYDGSAFPPWRQVVPTARKRVAAALTVDVGLLARACEAGLCTYPKGVLDQPAGVSLFGSDDDALSPIVLTNRPHALVDWLAVIMPVRT